MDSVNLAVFGLPRIGRCGAWLGRSSVVVSGWPRAGHFITARSTLEGTTTPTANEQGLQSRANGSRRPKGCQVLNQGDSV